MAVVGKDNTLLVEVAGILAEVVDSVVVVDMLEAGNQVEQDTPSVAVADSEAAVEDIGKEDVAAVGTDIEDAAADIVDGVVDRVLVVQLQVVQLQILVVLAADKVVEWAAVAVGKAAVGWVEAE